MFIFCLIALSSAYIAFAEELCSSQTPCRCITLDNQVIDLSSVGTPGFPKFYEVNFPQCNVTDLYSYNPCFSFDSTDKHTVVADGYKRCTEAAACIRKPGGPDGQLPEEHMIGLQSSARFENSSNYGNYIKYTVPGSERLLIVKLVCQKEAKEHILEMANCPTDPAIVLKLTSKCACPNECSSIVPDVPSPGLSVGSKLLIAFFTILLAYFVVGVIWNYCNGSQGAELIPNVEFWNDLPTLIMEGVSFTCSCCGRQSSYGEV